MDKFIYMVNEVLKEWQERFDISKAITFNLHKKTLGKFYLNDEIMLPIKDGINLTSAFFDIENITLYLSNNRNINIKIAWPNDDKPYIDSVLIRRNTKI